MAVGCYREALVSSREALKLGEDCRSNADINEKKNACIACELVMVVQRIILTT